MGDRVAVLKDGLLQQVRHPARAVRPPGQRLRRRLHRLPGDEPAADPGGRGRRCSSATPSSRCRARSWPRPAAGRRDPRRPAGGPRRWPTDQGIAVDVDLVEELGADAYVYGDGRSRRRAATPIIARVDGRRPPEKGETVHIAPKAGPRAHVRHPTGQRLATDLS